MSSPNKKFILTIILGLVLVNTSILQIETNNPEKSKNTIKDSADIERPNSFVTLQDEDKDSLSNSNNSKKLPTASLNINSKANEINKDGLSMSFDQFKKKYRKRYSLSEQALRKINYEKNIQKLLKSDCQSCGVTGMFDRSSEEIKALTGFVPDKNLQKDVNTVTNLSSEPLIPGQASGSSIRVLTQVPSSFDWRSRGVVTSVKDQGDCGSCWAFSATAFLQSEGIRRGKFDRKIDLSEQYLMQCTANGDYKCNGGDPINATIKGINRGMPQESKYPYTPGYDYPAMSCSGKTSGITFAQAGSIVFYRSKKNKYADSTIIRRLLHRPLIIAVNAEEWTSYLPKKTKNIRKKIFSCSEATSKGNLNHAVLLVGYTQNAWLIKNSWGTDWGDNGYIWVTRNKQRNCGIGYYWATVTSTFKQVA